jgi:hypothetical protein
MSGPDWDVKYNSQLRQVERKGIRNLNKQQRITKPENIIVVPEPKETK